MCQIVSAGMYSRRERRTIMVAILVVLMVAAALGIDAAVRAYRRKRGLDFAPGAPVIPLPDWARLPVESLLAPAGLFYGQGHTWLKLQDDGSMRVGIDDFLNHAVGSVDDLEFLSDGSEVKRGEPIARLKQNDVSVWVRSPVSGQLLTSHRDVDPVQLQHDPYGSGWLVELSADNPASDISVMRIGRRVRDWFREEALRYGRFLTSLQPVTVVPTMQDGGEPVKHRLAALGPRSAAEFDHTFLRYAQED
jgi:glycine cleavage system H protein